MDGLFKQLLKNDEIFKNYWLNTPFLYCEEKGSSHSLASYNFRMEKDSKIVKQAGSNKSEQGGKFFQNS